jgi:carbamoyltransferase
MKILAIVWSTCSTATVMVDGRIMACVSEERFSRKKNDESYPLHSIAAVLTESGISPEELDLVVMAGERFDPAGILCHKWSNSSVQDRLREQQQYWYPRLYQRKDISYIDVFADKLDTTQYPGNWGRVMDFLKNGNQENSNVFFQEFRRHTVSKHLGINPRKIIFAHHHRAHAYYSYYGSPIKKDRVLILTADAWGDDMNASVSVAEGGNIQTLSTSQNFIIGRLYRYITLLLGMKPDEHEYKVMGLAAYAKPKYYQEPLAVFKNTMYVDGLGFVYKETPSDLYFYFKDRLEGYRFDSTAGAIQQYTQDILVQWARNALKTAKARRICLGGGVAMNVKAMMEIAKLPEVDEIFICPSPSDESLAIGAAYVAMHDICCSRGREPVTYLKPLGSACLGPKTDLKEVKAIIKKARAQEYAIHERPDVNYIAQLIAAGKIIGRCVGRSEFGARALGNRSILADPRKPQVIKTINEKVKGRDFWMPFAPSILAEQADRYIVNPKGLKAPYMTVAFETKSPSWEDLKAAIHQYDLTIRPQVVNKELNPAYYDLISEFYKLTGVGSVLNTSFNIHGEAIVQTPQDAFDVLERTNLDGLILDGYLIERKVTEK